MTEAEIRAEYAIKIAEATEELDKLKLTAEMERTVAAHYMGAARERDVAEWRRQALTEFPRARPDEIRGDSAEEMKASAKSSHDHFEGLLAAERERIQKETLDAVGRRSYGSPTTTGAGGPPPTNTNAYDAVVQRVNEAAAKNAPILEGDIDEVLKFNLGPSAAAIDIASFAGNPRIAEILARREQAIANANANQGT